jgi:acyl-ACP thioesterase
MHKPVEVSDSAPRHRPAPSTFGAVREPGADRIVPVPDPASDPRVFHGERRVRFGDVSPDGRARFDALACYLQDVSNDDTVDAGLEDDIAWVVRRTAIEVHRPAEFREMLDLATFCSGVGSRWAERRVSLRGDLGAHIEAVTVWVHVDLQSGRPVPVDAQFDELYAPTALGRQVTSKLQHETTPSAEAVSAPWRVRASDFDLFSHVNNAASWAMVEEELATRGDLSPPYRAELEYRAPVTRADEVVLWRADSPGRMDLWALPANPETGTVPYLTGRITAL